MNNETTPTIVGPGLGVARSHSEQPTENPVSGMVPSGVDHSRTISAASFGLTPAEAAGRSDVILDKSLGVWRELRAGESVGPDTKLAWDIGGAIVDLTRREAVQYGLVSGWDPEWGPEPVDPTALTDEELESLQAHKPLRAHGSEAFNSFSEDAPLEAMSIALQSMAMNVPTERIAELADQVSVSPNGKVQITDEARTFLGTELTMGGMVDEVVQRTFDSWSRLAHETIGPKAIESISYAAKFNHEAHADVREAYRKAILGQLTKADLLSLSAKWSGGQ